MTKTTTKKTSTETAAEIQAKVEANRNARKARTSETGSEKEPYWKRQAAKTPRQRLLESIERIQTKAKTLAEITEIRGDMTVACDMLTAAIAQVRTFPTDWKPATAGGRAKLEDGSSVVLKDTAKASFDGAVEPEILDKPMTVISAGKKWVKVQLANKVIVMVPTRNVKLAPAATE